ncbi:hypothetical protein DTO006G1_5859 [Penicillium roqueforti]|uniref:uncharacterized protein n=1 Tax=Penicillium roqueforti TaxID=5082 RepID=UPI00190A9F0F|nr:uncharacterized protein LCP9604111_2959 [Penicillium roqueforti]KAF9250755.1 hypothetical protein LCP9604111_2959 [Penicillium roqueforti]KAI2686836.1 hypothetical protein LCP963914a_4436 [Penicillium roqueforti]KAI2716131.1 hypothetical protein CBS147318_5982 [Penicillium roqueforti]KAI2717605.1 hypothetical protein CBS147332_4485 [Penicillium roqueforti]KAI2735958.1 hypothetical protein DTO012A1_8779 [Penicillium roqueforti]
MTRGGAVDPMCREWDPCVGLFAARLFALIILSEPALHAGIHLTYRVGETKVKHRSYSVIISLIYKKKPKK